jgi:hypothetical protein
VTQIREHCEKSKIDYLVLDSVAYASSGQPENSEAAIGYFTALKDIGVPGSLSIAHNTKNIPKSQRGQEKPFGSGFWHNSARLTLFVKPKLEPDGVTVYIAPRKNNLVKRPDYVAAKIQFGDERVSIVVRPMSQAEINILESKEGKKKDTGDKSVSSQVNSSRASGPTVGDRIENLLKARGSLRKEDLRKALPDISDSAFKKALQRSNRTVRSKEGLISLKTVGTA